MTPKIEYAQSVIEAQAAAWIVRLHGEQRSAELEEGLKRWLTESPTHAVTFESMTQAWDDATNLVAREQFPRVRTRRRPREIRHPIWRRGLVAAAVAAIAIVAFNIMWLLSTSVATDVGEQRILTLKDNSRVVLNTDSRIRVRYNDEQRIVELERGEALFEVAQDSHRPFVVRTQNREVRALGTTFVVRRYNTDAVGIVVVDGRVAVSEQGADTSYARESRSRKIAAPAPLILSHGDRAIIRARKATSSLTRADREGATIIDRPQIERVTAWRRGEVVFDKTALGAAVAEMNRYDEHRLAVSCTPESPHPDLAASQNPDPCQLLVSGLYRSGDNEGFARAIARIYDLQVRETSREIILTK